MITSRRAISVFIFLLIVSFLNIGWCGKIIYPWNATTAIVKAGESFSVLFDADQGQTVKSVVLQGPYNSVYIPSVSKETGSWIYDDRSGYKYNTRITVYVPSDTPAERYNLILNTSAGEEVSLSAVKVIRENKSDYTIFHISDTHLCQDSDRETDGTSKKMQYLSVLVDIANIIGPELVFITGDIVNSRSWDEGNATYLTTWPSTLERVNFYYKGSHENGYLGVHDFNAAAFSCNGNHDCYERDDNGDEKNKFAFWNTYHGLRMHHFTYGNTRFMAFSDAFDTANNVEAKRHSAWLNDVGPGKLRVIYKHFYHHVPQPWATDNNIQLGFCGHNHHIGGENPYTQGITDMYIANFTEYTTFNLFMVDSNGNYTVANNLAAIGNPKDESSLFRPNLTLEYAEMNDGTFFNNTATLVNKFDIGFPEARVRFVMPKGKYAISKGRVEQIIENDAVSIIDVRVHLERNSTTSVEIIPGYE